MHLGTAFAPNGGDRRGVAYPATEMHRECHSCGEYSYRHSEECVDARKDVLLLASIAVPTGTIKAFAGSSCPSGWSEYTAANKNDR